MWASLSNLIALRTRNSELIMVAGLLLTLPALFLSPAFFPKPLQPSWLRAVAGWNPAAYLIETGQRLMTADGLVPVNIQPPEHHQHLTRVCFSDRRGAGQAWRVAR